MNQEHTHESIAETGGTPHMPPVVTFRTNDFSAGTLNVPLVARLRWLKRLLASSGRLTSEVVGGMSPGWQALFLHLKEKGIMRDETPMFEPLHPDEPKLFSLRSFATEKALQTDGHRGVLGYSRGISDDFEHALIKTAGELLERYPLSSYRAQDLLMARPSELRKREMPHLNIQLLPDFFPKQKELFPEFNRTPDGVYKWIWAQNLATDAPALVPAQMVFWNYCRHSADTLEPELRPINSNGAAGHITWEKAALAGIYELIQRDGFLLQWLSKTPPGHIRTDALVSERLKRLIALVEKYALEVHFLDTTSDIGVPSCVCALIDRKEGSPRPAIALGGGCANSMEDAMESSITEALGVSQWTRSQPAASLDVLSLPPFTQTAFSQGERIMLWGKRDMLPHFEWYLRGPDVAPREAYSNPAFSDKERLDLFVAAMKERGEAYHPYIFTSDHPILREVRFFSVRAIIPALLPLYTKEHIAPLASKRLEAMFKRTPTFEDIYSVPHPFP